MRHLTARRPRRSEVRQPFAGEPGHRRRAPVRQGPPPGRLQRRNRPEIGGERRATGKGAHRRLGPCPGAQCRRRDPHQVAARGIQVGPERRRIAGRIGMDIRPPRRDQRRETGDRHSPRPDQRGQRRHHLVGARGGPALDLLQRIQPPLQAHLGDHRLGRHPGRTRHLDIERIEHHQVAAPVGRRGHRRQEPVRIAPAHQLGAGLDAHSGRTTSSA